VVAAVDDEFTMKGRFGGWPSDSARRDAGLRRGTTMRQTILWVIFALGLLAACQKTIPVDETPCDSRAIEAGECDSDNT
jgi:hypothetical protein